MMIDLLLNLDDDLLQEVRHAAERAGEPPEVVVRRAISAAADRPYRAADVATANLMRPMLHVDLRS
jgi:predicted transcriptional regulator